jgi:hypothetical protein
MTTVPPVSDSAEDQTRLWLLRLTVEADDSFPVPKSDGYPLYGALLSAISDGDEAVASHIHDADTGYIRNSGLHGEFGDAEHRFQKRILANEPYHVSIGIFVEDDHGAYDALTRSLGIDRCPIPLEHGDLHVTELESETTTCSELLARADALNPRSITFEFQTPTCIKDAPEITTMFPARGPVFASILGKWRTTAPSALDFGVDRETVEASLIEKPDFDVCDTHSVVVNRATRENGETKPIKMQGFTGACEYQFKNESPAVRNAITALALFAEYSGVGSAVARGCGTVQTDVQ